MSTNPHTSRFALFPQTAPLDEQGRRPAIRRYALTRLNPAPRETRIDENKRSHG